ncbi:hypothetical protein [Mucilaginibacter myungsuensis]|nr:hypothetical protein [Mucilaginibacter myungsuensis]
MKLNLYYTSLLLLITFAACKKSTTTEPTPDPKPTTKTIKLLTRMAKVVEGGKDTVYTDITYDDRNRIRTIKTGITIKQYNYLGDELISLTRIDDQGKVMSTYASFIYADGVLTSGLASTTAVTYEMSGGKVLKRNNATQTMFEFTYSGNNMVSYKQANGQVTGYEFGTAKNPFFHTRHRYYQLTASESEDIYSENAPTKFIIAITPVFRGSIYTYVVDKDGLPLSAQVKATQFADPSLFSTTVVVYTYTSKQVPL